LLSAANRRSDAIQKKRDTGIIEIKVLWVVSLRMNVNLAKFEGLAFDYPIIKQGNAATCGFELLEERKCENAEG
jgi:hypothetical protein